MFGEFCPVCIEDRELTAVCPVCKKCVCEVCIVRNGEGEPVWCMDCREGHGCNEEELIRY